MKKWKQICAVCGAAAVMAVPAWAQTTGGDTSSEGAYGSGLGSDTMGGSSTSDQGVAPSQLPSGQSDLNYGAPLTSVNPTQIPGSATDNTMGGGMGGGSMDSGSGLGTGEGGAN